jgi:HAD superfamily hydrolase (TIGR01549 family)
LIKNFEVILFDLGSTLIYFDGDWAEVLPELDQALLASLEEEGLALRQTDFLIRFEAQMQAYYSQRDTEFIEYTTAFVVRSVLADMGFTGVSEETIRRSVEAMYAVSQKRWQPEPDALPTLSALRQRGYRLGLISNAGDDQDVQTLVEKAKIRPYFEVILTSAARGIRKPNPRIFHDALAALGQIPSQKAAMVGDTLGADILGAQNAGIYSVWITRRADTAANRDHLDTIQPDVLVGALHELLELFP